MSAASDRREAGPSTLVIGFTQTQQWFEAAAASAAAAGERWSLLWANGGGVDKWQNADFEGWTQPLIPPATRDATGPDRVLLTISGPYGSDEEAWANAIRETIAAIRARYGSAPQIALQPIVGGPGHALCPNSAGAGAVRAAWLHPHIDNAIKSVVSGDVVAGFSPAVRRCADFANDTGHLTPDAAIAAGAAIAAYYHKEGLER